MRPDQGWEREARRAQGRVLQLEQTLRQVRDLADSWTVADDVYLHLDGQDLGYADAAVQILAILDKAT